MAQSPSQMVPVRSAKQYILRILQLSRSGLVRTESVSKTRGTLGLVNPVNQSSWSIQLAEVGLKGESADSHPTMPYILRTYVHTDVRA